MKSLISVIIPVYNLEDYISRCLDSILRQTYTNLQILVINDGSSDNSAEIVTQYVRNDSRVVLINKDNEGVSTARNIGLNAAIGEYVMFVDGDDWIEDDMIENLYALSGKGEMDFVGGGFVFEDLASGRKRYSPGNFEPQYMVGNAILKNFFLGHYIWGSVWGGIYRLDFLNRYSLRFEKEIKYGEDVFFNTKVMSKANKIVVCKNHFYHILVRSSSVTRSSVHELKEKKEADYEAYLKKEGLWEEYSDAYKVWFIRSGNYKLYHLALKVGINEYIAYYRHYVSVSNYLEWNTFKRRRLMNLRNHILSLFGLSAHLSWMIMYIPTLFGKKILT